jgi:hypothetical protein
MIMEIPSASIPSAAQRGLDRAIRLHLFDPNVSLIDLGFRIRDSQNQKLEPELCVRIHVRCKLKGAAFESFAEQNPERVIDPKRIGFPVDVPQADYRLSQPRFPSTLVASNLPNGVCNPMQGGISISNAFTYNYGTLGGKVIDRQTGAAMLLSNWHVLYGASYIRAGMAVCQPGLRDGGHVGYTIGYLKRHALDQFIDAAIAELTDTRPLINNQLGIGPVTGVGTPQLGMRITKSGRRTGITTGMIDGIDGREAIELGGEHRVIRSVVHIAQLPKGGQISAPGDSGSWWLAETTHQAVGLHFAGSDDPEYGLAIAMSQVLDALKVDIAL